MTFTLADWMIYTLWALFGFMMLDFLIAFAQSFWRGSLHPNVALVYLKDMLYYVLPMNLLMSLISIDPTGWIFVIGYFIGGLAVISKYVLDIISRFR